jgi:hypothetical protein
MEQLYWAIPIVLLVLAIGFWKPHRHLQNRRKLKKEIDAASLPLSKPPNYGRKRRARHNSKKTRGRSYTTRSHKYMAHQGVTQHRLSNVTREEEETKTSKNKWWT